MYNLENKLKHDSLRRRERIWNSGYVFCITWDSSVECTWISELMFTPELEPSIIRLKLQPVIQLEINLVKKLLV